MTSWPTEPARPRGFSLLELSIALIIIGILSIGLLRNTHGQRLSDEENRVARQMSQAIEALYGFSIAHGRLPCPADPAQNSGTGSAGEEDCPREHGALPWLTLSLPETDPWGQRFSYYARREFTTPPTAGTRAGFSLTTAGNANVRPAASAGNKLADTLPAVLVSHGANGAGGYRSDGRRIPAGGPDETENADADLTFVHHPPTPDYDDRVDWIIPGILFNRLLAAGRLP